MSSNTCWRTAFIKVILDELKITYPLFTHRNSPNVEDIDADTVATLGKKDLDENGKPTDAGKANLRLFAIAPAMYLLLQQIALENFSDKYTSQALSLISFVNKD